jgi:hypothetical protein
MKLNFGQIIWYKSEVLLTMSSGTIWVLGERDGNTLGTVKKTQNLPPLLPKKEKTGPLILSGC